MLSGLVGVAGLLRLEGDTTVLIALHGDRLIIYESSVLFRVLVAKIEGVSRELSAAPGFALDKVGILVSCSSVSIGFILRFAVNVRTISQRRSLDTLGRSAIASMCCTSCINPVANVEFEIQVRSSGWVHCEILAVVCQVFDHLVSSLRFASYILRNPP